MKYIASPYTDDSEAVREERYEQALKFTAKLTKKGAKCFSPIVYTHEMAKRYDMPKDFDFWVDTCLYWLGCCTELVVLCIKGWEMSKGVHLEILYAESQGIPITYEYL